MWLTREKRAACGLNLRYGASLEIPDGKGWDSLILLAAHTLLPEAGVQAMPGVARHEVDLGLGGRLRETIASADADDETELESLRDEVMAEVGSWCGTDDPVGICDAVHAGRLLRGECPVIVGAGSMVWYHYYRRRADPRRELLQQVRRLYDTWLNVPDQRLELERDLRDLVLDAYGDVPESFLGRDLQGTR